MAPPAFLNSSFRYLSTLAVTDVNTVISDVRSELVTNGSPAWTEPSSQLFKSPVDADGRFLDILLSRIDATTLEMRVRDQNVVTVCTRRAFIDAAGTEVRYFTGQYHFLLDFMRATPEQLFAGIVDASPESQASHLNYVYGGGHRNNAGTAGNNTLGESFMVDSGTAAAANRTISATYDTAAQQRALLTPTGAYVFAPLALVAGVAGTVYHVGRRYQMLFCNTGLAFGTEIVVPIDVGVTGTFKVLGYASQVTSRVCMRKA